MAIARCKDHPLESPKHNYEVYAFPVGYPETAAICGRAACENPALIWLEPAEVKFHKSGQRVFDVKTKTIKVRVAPNLNSN